MLEARLALRRGQLTTALAMANDTSAMEGIPAAYSILGGVDRNRSAAHLGRLPGECQERLASVGKRIQPGTMSGTWGEFLRLRGRIRAAGARETDAYHDFGQSVSIFELLGERYQAGLSYLELGRLAGSAGARSRATKYLNDARALFASLGAVPQLAETVAALAESADRGHRRLRRRAGRWRRCADQADRGCGGAAGIAGAGGRHRPLRGV